MIENMLRGNYSKLELLYVRMSFSKEMDQIGKFKLAKILHLIATITRIYWHRLSNKISVLYYPPAGPDKIPMYRDMVLLICCRWLFPRTVFHFHAGGLTDLYSTLSPTMRYFFRKAYYHPDASIMLSSLNPEDGQKLQSRKTLVIPYGIKDHYSQPAPTRRDSPQHILFVGVLQESKGVLILIEALSRMQQNGIDFTANLVGKFQSEQFRIQVNQLIAEYGLEDRVSFPGVLLGEEKWQQFSQANIFCYPTFFESETFGLVVLEAMQHKLPCVVTNWRGVPSLVRDGESGFIVPTNNAIALADKITVLCEDSELARSMGENARADYLASYSEDMFISQIENALLEVAHDSTDN